MNESECELEQYIQERTKRNPDFPRLVEEAEEKLRAERAQVPDDFLARMVDYHDRKDPEFMPAYRAQRLLRILKRW